MNKAKTICNYPGCLTICVGGRCEKHKRTWVNLKSKNRSGDPFYSSTPWRTLRLAFLREHPLCQCDDCLRTGASVAADVVDHIKPRCDRPDLQLTWENLRSMAAAHHNRRTARDRMNKRT